MSDQEKAISPILRPGIHGWLRGLLGTPKPSMATGPAPLPASMSMPHFVTLAVTIPDGTDGDLISAEIRDVLGHITFSAGRFGQDAVWRFTPDELNGLTATVPGHTALPLTITAKVRYVARDGDDTWTEVFGIDLAPAAVAPETEGDATGGVEKQSDAATPPSAPPQPLPMVMAVVDLDVSVGTRAPDVLSRISITFEGVPDGAALSAGMPLGDGKWLVQASELDKLAIMLPRDMPGFDLGVVMDSGGTDTQTATLGVVNEEATLGGDDRLTLRLGPPELTAPTRFKVYADGSLLSDLCVNWRDAETDQVDLDVAFDGSLGLPFEIVVRFAPMTDMGGDGPKFLGATIAEIDVAPDSSCLSAHGEASPGALTWHGDLILDVHRLTRSPRTEAVAVETVAPPAPIVIEAPTEVASPDETSAEAIPEAKCEPREQSHEEREPYEPEPSDLGTAATEEAAAEETDTLPTLVMTATPDDIRNRAFLDELRQLRAFIIDPQRDTEGSATYARLGIDVGKWRDMQVNGPTGAPLDLNPAFESLAPPGGVDNARSYANLRPHRTALRPSAPVIVRDLPPGTLLTHGENLGNGEWRLSAHDLDRVTFVGAVAGRRTALINIDEESARHAVLLGPIADALRPETSDLRPMTHILDANVFDPDGYGQLSLTIGDMPPGSILDGGKNHGDGVWTVECRTGDPVTIWVCGQSRPFSLTLTCVALDTSSGASMVVTSRLHGAPRTGELATGGSIAA